MAMTTQIIQQQLERGLQANRPLWAVKPVYRFELYTGRNAASTWIIQALQQIFTQQSQTSYRLEVIDIWDNPERVEAERIVATPTLIQRYPLPGRRLVGEISDLQALRGILDLPLAC